MLIIGDKVLWETKWYEEVRDLSCIGDDFADLAGEKLILAYTSICFSKHSLMQDDSQVPD